MLPYIKKTKIVATISDKNCTVAFIKSLYQAGMNVVRLNSAHQDIQRAKHIIDIVREVSDDIAILIDTKGPEIRTTEVEYPLDFKVGDTLIIKADPAGLAHGNTFYVNCRVFIEKITVGSMVLIDDGYVELEVIEKNDAAVICKAINSGTIKSRKSVNVPNVDFELPALNEKDKEFIAFAAREDIDFIAHSFVRNKGDVIAVQDLLHKHNSNIKVIAKIENQQGIDNIDEILDNAYGIMVARGDLAVEVPFEQIPGVQRMIIKKCNKHKKPVIVATQMLHSMIQNTRPTRAEVNDVASAIYRRTDAVMLSGETAFGKYPVESVATMAKIAGEVEKTKDNNLDMPVYVINTKVSDYLAKYAVEASIELEATAIIADTNTGRTIRALSGYQGHKPIFAICYSKKTMRELALSFGVIPLFMKPKTTTHAFIIEALQKIKNEFEVRDNDHIVILAGNFGAGRGASFIEIGTVKNLMSVKT